eukprot:scaffold478647_cov19-Prasinocladus_malaysianus.AAC.1
MAYCVVAALTLNDYRTKAIVQGRSTGQPDGPSSRIGGNSQRQVGVLVDIATSRYQSSRLATLGESCVHGATRLLVLVPVLVLVPLCPTSTEYWYVP